MGSESVVKDWGKRTEDDVKSEMENGKDGRNWENLSRNSAGQELCILYNTRKMMAKNRKIKIVCEKYSISCIARI